MEEQIKLLVKMNQILTVQNERLAAQNEHLTALLEKQAAEIQRQSEKIDELLKRIDELTHKKNSRNSSVPPSSDGYAKPGPKKPAEVYGCKTWRPGRSQGQFYETDEGARRSQGTLSEYVRRLSPKRALPCPYCRKTVRDGYCGGEQISGAPSDGMLLSHE